MSNDNDDVSRRTFMKAAGLTAAAGAVGASANGVAAHGGFHSEFANWRVREAEKVWERGYRGRADRTLGLTDSGIDARHPDLGPWNGVRVVSEADGGLRLIDGEDVPEETETGETENASGTATGGTFATGSEEVAAEFTAPAADRLHADLYWSPDAAEVEAVAEEDLSGPNDYEFRIDRRVDDGWEAVGSAATATMPESVTVDVSEGETYRYVIEHYAAVAAQYEIEGRYTVLEGEFVDLDAQAVFEDADTISAGTPKTLGWYNETDQYGTFGEPRDENGHGTHCASIMAGSGRASHPDPGTVQEAEPNAVLTAGDVLSYEVQVTEPRSGVFASAYGDAIELVVEGPDGRQVAAAELASDTGEWDNVLAVGPAETAGTHTVYVRPTGGELVSTGRVESVSVGALRDAESTAGDRTADGDATVHAGVAPNTGIVGLQGLSGPTADLGEDAAFFAETFNMRAVNMSWGYAGGLPLGAFGGQLDDTIGSIASIAEAGILPVAAAGNAATPANGNGAPGVAEEAVSVVATGALDGIAAYSSGGIGGFDADGEFHGKPDVTAPGGTLTTQAFAADIGEDPEDDDEAVRGYTGKSGTSMASPYACGVVGLLAEAMESDDAPDSICLPEPADADRADAMRLKAALLSTASTTAFTAAPYHRAKAPTYTHAERDPFEGYGRVNPDAAVDAVTRELLDADGLAPNETVSASSSETVGLDRPTDARAVAGYVDADGTLEASVSFSHYGGGNAAMAKGDPHVDLFVYDAATPAGSGEPNVLASDQGVQGSASVSVDVEDAVVYVVAKLVNVPGAVNGFDVQVHFDLDVSLTAPDLPAFSAAGTREGDGSVFTGGQTNRVTVTLEDVTEVDRVRVTDRIPGGWRFAEEYSDGTESDGLVDFGEVDVSSLSDGDVAFTYFVEAPSGLENTATYDFGPARVEVVEGGEGVRNDEAGFTGTQTVAVVGQDTSL